MTSLRDRWKTERLHAVFYDRGVQNRRIAKAAGRLMWGYDTGGLWRSIDLLATAPAGCTVLDVPCGGGIAVPAARRLRYVGADLSPVMLDRARRHGPVTLVQADVNALPFPDATFDLCVTYNGLHCLPDPPAAVAEMARVLRPGGTLRGSTVTRGSSRRHDALIAVMRRLNMFGPSGTPADLAAWLTGAGLTDVRVTLSGAIADFTARRPPDIRDAPLPGIR
ncbi:class I SAM-dependent methyltransferase [Actinomadura xylanilytica]|uniref:class I SAM-dependent methyltransferase n=1 Tax=Actinomadura xylanilytica TaxID=887459 RepID=UPI00255B2034|nr:class I SAM-dependent methyltransferase [Actinomadura xylanilytica]MDL4773380.1 class I SAM-dependent methyltransferase [Actinomadura xylanilytica]